MLGVHLIHPALPATDLGTAQGFYHDRLGPGEPDRGPTSIVFRCGGGARLALTRVSLDGLDPRAAPHGRACAIVSFSRAATRGPMARHQG